MIPAPRPTISIPKGYAPPSIDRKEQLKSPFNTHTVLLPDGDTEIVIHENGEVFIKEKDQEPRRVRSQDKVMRNIIK